MGSGSSSSQDPEIPITGLWKHNAQDGILAVEEISKLWGIHGIVRPLKPHPKDGTDHTDINHITLRKALKKNGLHMLEAIHDDDNPESGHFKKRDRLRKRLQSCTEDYWACAYIVHGLRAGDGGMYDPHWYAWVRYPTHRPIRPIRTADQNKEEFKHLAKTASDTSKSRWILVDSALSASRSPDSPPSYEHSEIDFMVDMFSNGWNWEPEKNRFYNPRLGRHEYYWPKKMSLDSRVIRRNVIYPVLRVGGDPELYDPQAGDIQFDATESCSSTMSSASDNVIPPKTVEDLSNSGEYSDAVCEEPGA